MRIERKEIKRSWWYKTIRSTTFYFRKHFLIFWLFFFTLITLWFIFCYKEFCGKKTECCELQLLYKKSVEIESKITNCCNCKIEAKKKEESEMAKRRKEYGGHTGYVTVSLQWNTVDDLDLHLIEPGGIRIFYSNKKSPNGGVLDVDKNAGTNYTSRPIENIYYVNKPASGEYSIEVMYYSKHSQEHEIPYEIQLTIDGKEQYFNGTHTNPRDKHLVHTFTIN